MTSRRVSPITRLGWFFLMIIGVMLVVALYFVKTRASQARSHVRSLEHTVAQEEAGIRMLRAEIAHLENPERLSQMAEKHLNLQPVAAERTLTLEQAARTLPKKSLPETDDQGGVHE